MYYQMLEKFNQSQQWNECTDSLINEKMNFRRQSVLDVGCGIGTFCYKIRARLPYVRVVGIDVDIKLLSRAMELVEDAILLPYDGKTIPLPDESMDWVTCIHAISHVDDPEQTLAEIFRVVRKNGMVSFVLPNLWFDVLMTFRNLLTGYQGDRTIKHHWTPTQFERMLLRQGFYPVRRRMFGEHVKWFPKRESTRAWSICHAMRQI